MIENLRAGLDARYSREVAWLFQDQPWVRGYHIQPPVRRWHAVHLDSGATLGPAKNITELSKVILADHQARPLRPQPDVQAAEDPDLAALTYVFGYAYDLMPVEGGCLARRRGGSYALAAATWDEMRDELLADLAARTRTAALMSEPSGTIPAWSSR